MSETDLVRACLAWLALRHIPAWRINAGGFKTGKYFVHLAPAGFADIVAIAPGGRFLAIECKRPSGRLTPDQVTFAEDVRRAGGLAVVVRSVEDLAMGVA